MDKKKEIISLVELLESEKSVDLLHGFVKKLYELEH